MPAPIREHRKWPAVYIPVCLSVAYLTLMPLTVLATGLTVDEAAARHAAAHQCARSGDSLCAFENAHIALLTPAYLASLRRDNAHAHLAQWDWYAGYAFDAADMSPAAEKRRISELAIATLTARPNKVGSVEKAGLHVLHAEACIVLADDQCALASARLVAEREVLAGGNGQTEAGNWYVPHSSAAPGVDEFRLRLKAVIGRSQ